MQSIQGTGCWCRLEGVWTGEREGERERETETETQTETETEIEIEIETEIETETETETDRAAEKASGRLWASRLRHLWKNPSKDDFRWTSAAAGASAGRCWCCGCTLREPH